MTVHGRLYRQIGEIDEHKLSKYVPYIAGLLDGEGTFTIKWNKRARSPSFYPLIMVSMTNEEVISFLSKTLQVTYTRKLRKKSRRPYYMLRITTRHEIVMILEALRPWLIVKREHANIILKFIDLKEQKKLARKEIDIVKKIVYEQVELYLSIRQLNPKGRPFDSDELSSTLYDYIENYFKNKRAGL